jgi:hypothetical protein
MIDSPRRMLKFSEFISSTGDANDLQKSKTAPTELVSEAVLSPNNLSDPLPVLITFQRRQLIRLSDGRVIATYRDVRTGKEIVFPSVL